MANIYDNCEPIGNGDWQAGYTPFGDVIQYRKVRISRKLFTQLYTAYPNASGVLLDNVYVRTGVNHNQCIPWGLQFNRSTIIFRYHHNVEIHSYKKTSTLFTIDLTCTTRCPTHPSEQKSLCLCAKQISDDGWKYVNVPHKYGIQYIN